MFFMFNLLLVLIYVCFISLGLPDSLLGSAWPIMHEDISVPVSYAGVISMIISVGTIVSSFFSDKMVRKFGSGKITAISVTMTAVALLGFAMSNCFSALVFWSIPYGLGAGGVDSVLNNYVALHYKAQHMSWLHCFWGIGAAISPYIMSFSLLRLDSWSKGYFIVFVIQIILSGVIFFSIPLWKKAEGAENDENEGKPLRFREIISISGAVSCFLTFFCYCAFEVSASLWASSYLVDAKGISPEAASGFASLFYIGITVGRAINGFLAMKLNDRFLIRLGMGIIAIGVVFVFLPLDSVFALAGFVICGLGCAPIYPCIIHMTPSVFGRERSQAMIGIQMAFAYLGFCLMPPIFGFVAEKTSITLLPLYLALLLLIMVLMHEIMVRRTKS